MAAPQNKRTVSTLAAVFLAIPLAGCVSIQSPEETARPSASAIPTATASIQGTVMPLPKDPTSTEGSLGSVPKKTNGDSFQLGFEKILEHAQKKKCSQDTEISEDGQILLLVGNCKEISISGTGNMIVADNARSVEISGAGNIVAVKSVRQVDVSGIGNVVAWRSSDTRSTDSGQSNSLGRHALDGVELAF